MPANRNFSDGDEDFLTDHLDTCPDSGIGFSTNITYRHHGQSTCNHDMEDQSFRIIHHKNGKKIRLYGIFDGFDNGNRVSIFAAQKMVATILLEDMLDNVESNDEIKNYLRQAFAIVDGAYFNSIGDLLAERLELQMKIANMNTYEAMQKQPETMVRIEQLNQMIQGGATGVMTMIVNDRLFISNAGQVVQKTLKAMPMSQCSSGDSRAILVKSDQNGRLTVFQMTKLHDINNSDEQLRLTELGLTEDDIRHFGIPYCTRCIGDYRRKGGYKEIEPLSFAKSEPVIADPEVQGGFEVDETYRFLILVSSGVYTTLEDCRSQESIYTNCTANGKLAGLVALEFQQQRSLNAVAQAVLDSISREYHEAFVEGKVGQHREDMTLLVVNFGQPMPMAKSSVSSGHFDPKSLQFGGNSMSKESIILSSINSSMEQVFILALSLDENGKIAPYISFEDYENHPDREIVEDEIDTIFDTFDFDVEIDEKSAANDDK